MLEEKAKVARRVSALIGIEATQTSNLTQDTSLSFGKSVNVLFDFRATHSFIYVNCVGRLGLLIRDFGCELVVSTPTSGQVSTQLVCVECYIKVAGYRTKVNLICLPLEGMDMRLGMDWLSINHTVIDYGRYKVVFPNIDGLKSISTHEVMKELRGALLVSWQ